MDAGRSGTTPQDLKDLYEAETGRTWDPEEGVPWLNKNYGDLPIHAKVPRLDKSAHITLSDKASWLSQQPCHVCSPGFPISTIPLRIPPRSWQSTSPEDKHAFRSALRYRLTNTSHAEALGGPICLAFLFVCSASRRVRDLDNMAKLLMDSIKGIVMGDDKDVDHLNLMRITHEGEEEYVYLRISGSNLNDHGNVVHPEMRHSWAGAEPLEIEDFRELR